MIGLTQKLTLKGDRVNTEHDTEAEGQAKQHLYLYDHNNKKSAHRGTEIFRASAIAIYRQSAAGNVFEQILHCIAINLVIVIHVLLAVIIGL